MKSAMMNGRFFWRDEEDQTPWHNVQLPDAALRHEPSDVALSHVPEWQTLLPQGRPFIDLDSLAPLGTGPGIAGGPDGFVGRVSRPAPTIELIVQFRPGQNAASQADIAHGLGGQVVQQLRAAQDGAGDLVVMRFGSAQAAQAAQAALAHNPAIMFAEANEGVGVQATADDPYYTNGSLWGMYGDQTSPTNSYGSHAGEAWANGQTGSMKSVVGVIDTGMDYTHPDLYLNVWLNQREIPISFRAALVDTDSDGLITFRDLNQSANSAYVTDVNGNGRIDAGDLLKDSRWADGVDTDGNGYKDDLIGWDFVNNDNDPYDDNNHGTHVSGTIGGNGGDGVGVAGINWAVQIIPLKFLGATGSGSTSNALLALDYYTAAANASVADGSTAHFVGTNNSWGGGGYSQAMMDAIVRTAQADLLFVAAAGNSTSNNDTTANYPSNYSTLSVLNFEAVIAVAALTSSGALASYSSYGATTVDIGAPGSGIWSSVPGGGYSSFSGTSMATPHVMGSLALLSSIAPWLTAADLRAALLDTAIPTTSLVNMVLTGGRLDVATMILNALTPDTTAPLATFNPASTATGVATNANIVLTFSEAVQFGSGTITIKTSGGATFESYTIGSAGTNLLLLGNSLIINPTAEFNALTQYTIVFSDGAIKDRAGNLFVAPTDYQFTSGSSAMSLSLTGTAAADNLLGDSANDVLDGKAGTDSMNGRGGSDLYIIGAASDHSAAEIADNGASGVDELRFTSTASSTLTLYAGDTGLELVTIGTGTSGAAVTTGTTGLNVDASAVTSPLTIVGNNGANRITGTGSADTLIGNGGNDTLSGGNGNDRILGGLGNDTLTGGAGSDIFVFDTAPNNQSNKDTITDFVSKTDQLHFALSTFSGSGLQLGAISAGQFWSGSNVNGAHDADDRFIYNTKSGVLYYDADGMGGQSAVQIAVLGTGRTAPALLATDIFII
ncbi:MAG: S8 family serine peptidase [Chakrabartia sp.]